MSKQSWKGSTRPEPGAAGAGLLRGLDKPNVITIG